MPSNIALRAVVICFQISIFASLGTAWERRARTKSLL